MYQRCASEVFSANCQLHWSSVRWSIEHERCTEWRPGSYEEADSCLYVHCFAHSLNLCARCDKEVRITAKLHGVHFPACETHQVFTEEAESF